MANRRNSRIFAQHRYKALTHLTRRRFARLAAMAGGALTLPGKLNPLTARQVLAQIPGGTLPPLDVDKYVTPLIKPPAMPGKFNPQKDKYKIAVRQFGQQILPPGKPMTTVWSYGSVDHPGTVAEGGTFSYPSFTIEATWNRETQVQWRNELVDADGNFLPHLLPVDQTLHWANPPGGYEDRDHRGDSQANYRGPVPLVTHVHGAHTDEQFDGYPEAWYLPNAGDIPVGYARTGTFYDLFSDAYHENWSPGTASFKYPNDQRATTLWYHDHTLGMTRLNVYAGPAGFYLIRGGPDDQVLDARGGAAILPGPAPGVGDSPFGTYYEIPIAIQDRSFNTDGSLFYPDHRAFFEGLSPSQLQIPFSGDPACGGPSDVAPIWQPEFFGNMFVVNGRTWPYLEVEQRRYRLRLLNGCNSRFLILDFNEFPGVEVWQIGADGGFLATPINVTELDGNRLLMSPAERADVIVDFTNVPTDRYVLRNIGPDEPFGGGTPGIDFDPADPDSTGQIMQFRVVPSVGGDATTPAHYLSLPAVSAPNPGASRRPVSLNEEESETVRVTDDGYGNIVLSCGDPSAEPFGPVAALLGTVSGEHGNAKLWNDEATETPHLGATETWEIHNFTADAHPIHIHLVQFQVLGREPFEGGTSIAGSNGPLFGETGFKDTVTAYPGEITRVQARFDKKGTFVWHCHIVEHEDNEMMRPFEVD